MLYVSEQRNSAECGITLIVIFGLDGCLPPPALGATTTKTSEMACLVNMWTERAVRYTWRKNISKTVRKEEPLNNLLKQETQSHALALFASLRICWLKYLLHTVLSGPLSSYLGRLSKLHLFTRLCIFMYKRAIHGAYVKVRGHFTGGRSPLPPGGLRGLNEDH